MRRGRDAANCRLARKARHVRVCQGLDGPTQSTDASQGGSSYRRFCSCDRSAPFKLRRSSFCRTEKSVVPSAAAGTTTSPSMIADPALMCQASNLVNPALARGHLVGRGRQGRGDEAREGGLDASDWRLGRGVGHRSGEPQRELTIRAEVAFDECLYR